MKTVLLYAGIGCLILAVLPLAAGIVIWGQSTTPARVRAKRRIAKYQLN